MSEDRSHVYQGAPRGAEDARVDDKGRLKLPAKYLEYLSARNEKTVFITTFDPQTRMSLIYPSSEWQFRQESWAAVAKRGPEFERAVEARNVVADHFGGDSEIDGQGRVLVPSTLRKALGLENSKVYLRFDNGRFNMLAEADYMATLNRALDGATTGNALLKSIGEG